MTEEAKSGELVRNEEGKFVKGVSGNPKGRPKGSKNVITLQKLLVEEAFRQDTAADVLEVLKMVVKQALEGDKYSQKLIWDSSVSKQALAEDKASGGKQNITVHTMNVSGKGVIEGEYVDVIETNEDTIQ